MMVKLSLAGLNLSRITNLLLLGAASAFYAYVEWCYD